MLIIKHQRTRDPHINLAVEEYLLRNLVQNEPIVYCYVNSPAIVIGRNQNVFEEIDLEKVQDLQIPVVRRLSGGGTVYHDPGNLNYCLVTPDQTLLNNFSDFTLPVIRALGRLGLNAELQNRSSIFVGSKKVSGNAQYASGGKLVSHGTLLIDTDLRELGRAICPRGREIRSRAIQSVRSDVANLSELMETPISIEMVKEAVQDSFCGSGEQNELELDSRDWKIIQELAEKRYRSWEWNIGRSPKFFVTRRVRLAAAEIVLQIIVEGGLVREIGLLEGDGLHSDLLQAMNACLGGVRYEPVSLGNAMQGCDLARLHPGVTRTQLLALLF